MNKQNAQVPSLQSVYEQLEHFWKGLNIYNGYYEYRTVTSIMFGLGSRLRQFSQFSQFSNNTIGNFVPNPYGLFKDIAIEKTYNPVEDINISLNSTGDWLNKMPLTSTYEMTKRKEYIVTIAGIVKSTSNGIEGYELNPVGNDGKIDDDGEVNGEVNDETVTEPEPAPSEPETEQPSESETVTKPEPEIPAEPETVTEQPEIPVEPTSEPEPEIPAEQEQPSEPETVTEPEQPSESETPSEPETESPSEPQETLSETETPSESEPESPVDIIENEAETASESEIAPASETVESEEPAPKKRGRRRKTE